MIQDGAIKEDIIGYLVDRNLPGDEITINQLADDILKREIIQGYLTISNALQLILQYQMVISLSNTIKGVINYDYR
jgi:hypothetical protein